MEKEIDKPVFKCSTPDCDFAATGSFTNEGGVTVHFCPQHDPERLTTAERVGGRR